MRSAALIAALLAAACTHDPPKPGSCEYFGGECDEAQNTASRCRNGYRHITANDCPAPQSPSTKICCVSN